MAPMPDETVAVKVTDCPSLTAAVPGVTTVAVAAWTWVVSWAAVGVGWTSPTLSVATL